MKKLVNYGKMIAAAKARLVKRARKSGICENFGRDELKKISAIKDNDVITGAISGEEATAVMRALLEFSEWCENFDTTQI